MADIQDAAASTRVMTIVLAVSLIVGGIGIACVGNRTDQGDRDPDGGRGKNKGYSLPVPYRIAGIKLHRRYHKRPFRDFRIQGNIDICRMAVCSILTINNPILLFRPGDWRNIRFIPPRKKGINAESYRSAEI